MDAINKSNQSSNPIFDAENERLFWLERQYEFHRTLKIALLLGSVGFLALIVVKVYNHHLPTSALSGRLLIVIALAGLSMALHFQHHTTQQIRALAKAAVTLSALYILSDQLMEANPDDYAEDWAGFLALYFFTYSQLYLSKSEALAFGWLSLAAVVFSGWWVGVAVPDLASSLIIMLIVNIYGYCIRCQLETYSRNSFRHRRKAEQATTDKTLYLCQLSHNLRQQVQTISCYSSVLDSQITRAGNPNLLGTSSKLGNAVDELNNALNHILNLAYLETGKQLPHLLPCDINQLLEALETQFAPLAAKKGLRLKVHRRRKPPYTVHTDASILQQVLANLIDNAIKYTESGWVLVACFKASATQLNIHVRDSGMGIRGDLREGIFKEFCRGGRRRVDAVMPGLGIGLAYVLKATEHLAGHRLHYLSRPGHGSDFVVNLPVGSPRVASNIGAGGHYEFAGCFVLAVDDDCTVLKALAEQLQSWGCIVQNASSLSETLGCLAENIRPPDLLVTDFYLENQETAHDIIAAVEAHCGPVPVLVLSAHAIPESDKAKWPENTLLLRKPANAAVLMGTMAKAMGKGNGSFQLPTSGCPNTMPSAKALTNNSDRRTTANF